MAVLADNAYGKSGIRLVRVERSTARHQLRDWTVAVRFRGPINCVTRSWLAAKPIATRNIIPIGAYSIRLCSAIQTSEIGRNPLEILRCEN